MRSEVGGKTGVAERDLVVKERLKDAEDLPFVVVREVEDMQVSISLEEGSECACRT